MSGVRLTIGDITSARVDAIVNAANSALQRGGGVCGAIHAAAGPALQVACDRVEPIDGVRCPVGEARITTAGALPARYVIHAVGPRYGIDQPSDELLASAYRNTYRLALENGCRSVAVPAISCGIFGYPLEQAAAIALGASAEPGFSALDITFYLFDQAIYDIFDTELQRLGND
jgi:O-acetyl-ADP-ribose deacetylase (regulator of RNase III)